MRDTKQEIVEGERQPNGTLVLDFSLKLKEGKDQSTLSLRAALSVVLSMIVSSIYLSWWAIERGHYINQVKVRLATVD